MNYLVETKIEYTSQLINIITPYIYDGIQSLYDESIKVAIEGEELKVFQNFLKKIPTWSQNILETETNRILKDSECSELLPQLLNAVIKSNIMVLTNTPPEKKHNIKIPKDIDFHNFIHQSYIETAKTIYNNPYLFYHKYSLYDVKKNQRDAVENIKKSINESIRKMLPLQYILKEYIGPELNTQDDNFDITISDSNKNILNKLLENDSDKNVSKIDSNLTQFNKLKEMLKNDPLDTNLSLSKSSDDNIKQPVKNIPSEPYILKKISNNVVKEINNNESDEKKQISISSQNIESEKINKNINNFIASITSNDDNNDNNASESVSYYRNNNNKIIDSFSNKSNFKSLFYSTNPVNNKKDTTINTADVQKYLKHETNRSSKEPSIKLSDDPNINSIKNIKTDKFKNKYFPV